MLIAKASKSTFKLRNAETRAHQLRCSSKHSANYYHLDVFIGELKTNSLWNSLDQICVVQDTLADSLLSLKGSNDATTRNGTPTFTANQGLLCAIGGLGQVDSQLTESTTPQFTQYDGHMMVYTRNKVNNNGNTCGYLTSGSRFLDSGLPAWQPHIQGASTTAVNTSASGTLIASCTASNRRDFVFNDTTRTLTSVVSYSINSTANFALNGGTVGSAEQEFSCWSIGDGLTLSQMQTYEDVIRNYAQRVGFDVY